MRAREALLSSPLFGDDLERCLPLIPAGTSDSAAFDHLLELLLLAGRSLPHALMMMVPMAHDGRVDLPEGLEGFYRYHSALLEPWDGPAALVVSDGRSLAAMLDRNGLRPGRWSLTHDGWLVLGSEAGMLPLEAEEVAHLERLHPGRLLIADLETGRLSERFEAELEVAAQQPYGEWEELNSLVLANLPEAEPARPTEPLAARQLAFGWSQEDLRVLIAPAARDGAEATGSMGNDAALAVLSDHEPSLFSYFKQRFAQVTNPAIDSARESIVMSLQSRIGAGRNILDETPEHARQLVLEHPILRDEELARIRASEHSTLTSVTLDITWPVAEGEAGMEAALDRIRADASSAGTVGATVLILSDRAVSAERAPIPSLLATSAVHHHLVREGTRTRSSLIVESGEPREVHHLAALAGYGAGAINPYLMLECLDDLHGRAEIAVDPEQARANTVAAMRKGLLKVMSKMGIATFGSYCGAQVFEAVGLDRELVEEHFNGTASKIGGVGLAELAAEALGRHARAWPHSHGLPLPEHVEDDLLPAAHAGLLPQGGIYAWRRDGERHMWDPETIAGAAAGGARPRATAPRPTRSSPAASTRRTPSAA